MESGHNAQVAQGVQARERRRSSISLAIPVCAHQMTASVEIRNDEVEFEAHGVKISHEGLFIEGTNVSEIHQDDLRVLRELGRGACSVVKQAQVRRRAREQWLNEHKSTAAKSTPRSVLNSSASKITKRPTTTRGKFFATISEQINKNCNTCRPHSLLMKRTFAACSKQ